MTTVGSVTLFGPAHSNCCASAQLRWAFQRGFDQPQTLNKAGRTRSCTGTRRHVSTMRLQACHAAAAGQLAQDVSSQDRQHMQHALSLAKKALGKTFPNPAVGCVIVKQGKVIGEGYHPKAGEPHAEVFALRAAVPCAYLAGGAGQQAAGATAYVTLEPCNHYGKTPPCSQALVDAKVSKVFVGVRDPNPLVNNAGVDTLTQAGINVAYIGGAEEQECFDINSDFMERMAPAK